MNEHEEVGAERAGEVAEQGKTQELTLLSPNGFPRPLVLDTHTISPRLAVRRRLR